MNKKSGTSKASATKLVKTIRRKTRQTYSSEENIRIVLADLRGEKTLSGSMRNEFPILAVGQFRDSSTGPPRMHHVYRDLRLIPV